VGVSVEEVIWCYRMILGREPESPRAISVHTNISDVTALREAFFRSREFSTQGRASVDLRQKVGRLPLDVPANEIEYSATETQLNQCLQKIKAAWSHMGNTKPHFSVITNKQYLPDTLEENISSFWASGMIEAECVEKILLRYKIGSLFSRVCVEFGCGVGRVTMGLAKRFGVVHAYDISQGHLSLAEQRAQELRQNNCDFHLCSDRFLEALEVCDVFYSRIVFQHNPPPVIVRLIENALRALKPNGIAIFQVPTYCVDYRFVLKEWLIVENELGMEMHCLPQHAIWEIIKNACCEVLEVREDDAPGTSRFISNTFVIRKLP